VFLGEFDHAIDDRGRLAVPAKFRPHLTDGLVITRGLERCLFGWTMDGWREIAQKLNELPLMNADARRIHRLMFSGATDCTMDRLGRILIPGFLREYATLEDSAAIVGLNNRFEIWSSASWHAERAMAEQDSIQLAEHLFSLGL
jgi:MraZ protein